MNFWAQRAFGIQWRHDSLIPLDGGPIIRRAPMSTNRSMGTSIITGKERLTIFSLVHRTWSCLAAALHDMLQSVMLMASLMERTRRGKYSCGQLKSTNWLSREPDFLAKMWRRIWNRTGKRSSKMVFSCYSHAFWLRQIFEQNFRFTSSL